MNILQLTYFKGAVECGGVSAAAKTLFVTQPAVSKQLKALEEELDAKLLYKKRGQLFLTQEGQVVYRHALKILGDMEMLRDELSDARSTVEGHVSIGCGPMTSRFILPEITEESLTRYPRLHLNIVETVATEIHALLRRNMIDLGISSRVSAADESIAYEELYRDRLVAICAVTNTLAKRSQLSLSTIGRMPFISYTKGNGIRQIIDENVTFRAGGIALESGNTETIIQYVKRDLGISLVPEYIIKTLRPEGIMVREIDVELTASFGVMYHADKYQPRVLRVLIELIKDYYRSNSLFRSSA